MTDEKLATGINLNDKITALLTKNKIMPTDVDELLLSLQNLLLRRDKFAPNTDEPIDQQHNQNFLRFMKQCYQVCRAENAPAAITKEDQLKYFSTLTQILENTIQKMQNKHKRAIQKPTLQNQLTECIQAFTLIKDSLQYSNLFFPPNSEPGITEEQKKHSLDSESPGLKSEPIPEWENLDLPIYDEKKFNKIKAICNDLDEQIPNWQKSLNSSSEDQVLNHFKNLLDLCSEVKLTTKNGSVYFQISAAIEEADQLKDEIKSRLSLFTFDSNPEEGSEKENLVAKLKSHLGYTLSGIQTLALSLKGTPVFSADIDSKQLLSPTNNSPKKSPAPSNHSETSPSPKPTPRSPEEELIEYPDSPLPPTPLTRKLTAPLPITPPLLNSPSDEPSSSQKIIENLKLRFNPILTAEALLDKKNNPEILKTAYQSFLSYCVQAELLSSEEVESFSYKCRNFVPENLLTSLEIIVKAKVSMAFNDYTGHSISSLKSKIIDRLSGFFSSYHQSIRSADSKTTPKGNTNTAGMLATLASDSHSLESKKMTVESLRQLLVEAIQRGDEQEMTQLVDKLRTSGPIFELMPSEIPPRMNQMLCDAISLENPDRVVQLLQLFQSIKIDVEKNTRHLAEDIENQQSNPRTRKILGLLNLKPVKLKFSPLPCHSKKENNLTPENNSPVFMST